MKQITALLLAVLTAVALVLTGCGAVPAETTPSGTTPVETTLPETVPAETTPAETTPAETTPAETTAPAETTGTSVCEKHTLGEVTVLRRSTAFEKGLGKRVCTKCGEEVTEELPTSIKILAVGNSFSVDAMEYLYSILEEAGIEEISLGNLYIGGCSLDTHYSNIKNNLNSYTYYTNEYGYWTNKKSTVNYALDQHEWDIITVQQASHDSGRPDTYRRLGEIVDYLADNSPEHCKIYWHMTWAYQQSSTHSGFANYGKDQIKMYDAIVNTVKEKVLTNEKIAGVIPVGTVIQNLRTSFVGDTLTRDGYHMSYAEGRYTAAMTWFAYLVGGDPSTIEWMPKGTSSFPKENLAPIWESIKNALEKPLEITESAMQTPPQVELETEELNEEDFARLKSAGYDPAKYEALVLDERVGAFFNSTSNTPNALFTNQSNSPNFITTRIFKKSELPAGTLISIASGYQYRPEGWKDMGVKNDAAFRPGNVTTQFTLVTNLWWSTYNYRAFNVSATQTRTMTEKDIGAFRIYVPKAGK